MPLQCTTVPDNLPKVTFYINTGFTGISKENVILIFGQKLDSGEANYNEPTLVSSLNNAIEKFGVNSMLYRMYKKIKERDRFRTVYAIPVEVTGTQSVRTVTYTGTVTSPYVETIYINGIEYTYLTKVGDTGTAIATGLASEINSDSERYVNASSSGEDLVLTSIEKGLVAGEVVVKLSYQRNSVTRNGQVLATLVETTEATGNPDLSEAIDNLKAEEDSSYKWQIQPYQDVANRVLYSDYLCATWDAKSSTSTFGFSVHQSSDIESYVNTLEANYNDAHLTLYTNFGMFEPAYIVNTASAIASISPYIVEISRNTDGLTIGGLRTPDIPDSKEMSVSNRDLIVSKGGVPWKVGNNSQITYSVVTTTATENDEGVLDITLRALDTVVKIGTIKDIVLQAVGVEFAGSQIRQSTTGYSTLGDNGESKITTLGAIARFIKGLSTTLAELRLINDPRSWSDFVDIAYDEASKCIIIGVSASLIEKANCVSIIGEIE